MHENYLKINHSFKKEDFHLFFFLGDIKLHFDQLEGKTTALKFVPVMLAEIILKTITTFKKNSCNLKLLVLKLFQKLHVRSWRSWCIINIDYRGSLYSFVLRFRLLVCTKILVKEKLG